MRLPEGRWRFKETGTTDALLRLESIGCELKLADVYYRVLDG